MKHLHRFALILTAALALFASTGQAGALAGANGYSTPGTYSWTAPAGVTTAYVFVWGGGGNGGYSDTEVCAGGGGGEFAGHFAYAVTPGNSYTVVVGANGQVSSFDGTVIANPGSNANCATPGAGGTGSTAPIHFDGGAGAAAVDGTHAGGGGGAAGAGETGHNASGSTGGSYGHGAYAPGCAPADQPFCDGYAWNGQLGISASGGNGRTGSNGPGLTPNWPNSIAGGGGGSLNWSRATKGNNGAVLIGY